MGEHQNEILDFDKWF